MGLEVFLKDFIIGPQSLAKIVATPLTRIFGDFVGKLRRIISQGRTLQIEDLYGLSTDELKSEALLILSLPAIPNDILTALSFHSEAEVRIEVCAHPSISPHLLVAMLSDEDPKVQRKATKELNRKKYRGWRYGLFLLRRTLRLPYTASFAVVKLFTLYLFIGFSALLWTDTRNFVSSYQKSSAEMKAYAFCTLSLKILDKENANKENCAAFQTQDTIAHRDVASATEDECPTGYSLRRGIHLPTCVKDK